MKTLLWPRLNRYIPIWPTPKQAAFMCLPHLEALYGGAAGGGKSVALLAAALMYVDVPGYKALLLRKNYLSFENQGGLVELSKRWLKGTDAEWREATSTWYFPSGATLSFSHLHDVGHLQGSEYQFIGVDELAEVEEQDYLYLFARLRAKEGFTIPLRLRTTSNPIGPGAQWVYQRFLVEGAFAGRVFIPARYEDNPHLDIEQYAASLDRLPWAMREALKEGRWDILIDEGLFRRSWFPDPKPGYSWLPAKLGLCRFWDPASTSRLGAKDPDYTAGVLVAREPDGVFYVLDVVRIQASELEVRRRIQEVAEADRRLADGRGWPEPAIRMELEPGSASNFVEGEFRRHWLAGYPFAGVRPRGSKVERARPLSAPAEMGELLLRRGGWNGAFLDELCAFPQGRYDDQVDALSGAIAELLQPRGGRARMGRVCIRSA